MKIKALLCVALMAAAVSCDKEEILSDEPNFDDWSSSWGIVDPSKTKTPTPKGLVYSQLVKKEELPTWLQEMTEEIQTGYILRAGSGDELLYFVYDTIRHYGRHYNALGKTVGDNPKLTDWVIIYRWYPAPSYEVY